MGKSSGINPTDTNKYLDLVRIIRAEVAALHDDCERVLGMFKTPQDHRLPALQQHMLRSFAGRRKGNAERLNRLNRLMIEAEQLALELE